MFRITYDTRIWRITMCYLKYRQLRYFHSINYITPSSPLFFPFLLPPWGAMWSQRCHLRRWQSSLTLRFCVFVLSLEVYARRSVQSTPFHLIITSVWHDTREKWLMARNPDKSWCHRHTSLKIFGRRPWLHGQQAFPFNWEIVCTN